MDSDGNISPVKANPDDTPVQPTLNRHTGKWTGSWRRVDLDAVGTLDGPRYRLPSGHMTSYKSKYDKATK